MITEKFEDPLDAIINKHKQARGVDISTDEETQTVSTNTVESMNEKNTNDDIDYGENDLAEEMANEDLLNEELRQQRLQEAEASKVKTTIMPPNELNAEYQCVAVDFQTNNIAIVTDMVEAVIKKHNLTSGGIPTEDNRRMQVMGELINIYHLSGEVITPEFEQIILDNWVCDDVVNNSTSPNEAPSTDIVVETKPVPEVPTINITVEKNTPLTINVDESITAQMNETHEVNIYVKEVSEKELKSATIIENSNEEGIITPYDPGVCDVPITLPLSAYRCVMRPINWFDSIKLNAPTSNNPSDNERKKWSVIYSHIKNTSIGKFEDFNDFLKKTKYNDKELLLWALLVATSDESEVLEFKCVNPKCGHNIKVSYTPRELVRLDEKLIPAFYKKTHTAAVGKEAIDHFNEITSMRKRYKLPDTGIIVEINEPSAYEFINNKLPLISELYHRYRPDAVNMEFDTEDPTLAEFYYLMTNAMFVSAMVIIKDNKEFRYTRWEDLETIITESLNTTDSGVLVKIIEKARSNVSPVSFVLSNVECPICKHVEKTLPVTDIGSTLLFQVSRRLMNTNVNLIEMESSF